MKEFQQHLLNRIPKHGSSVSFSVFVAKVVVNSGLESALTKVRKQAKAAGIAMRRKELEDLEAQSRLELSLGGEKFQRMPDTAAEVVYDARGEASGEVRAEKSAETFEECTGEAKTGKSGEAIATASIEGRSRPSAEMTAEARRRSASSSQDPSQGLPANSRSSMPIEMPKDVLVPENLTTDGPQLHASLPSTRDSPLNAKGSDLWYDQPEKMELESAKMPLVTVATREETDACPDVDRSMASDLELIRASCEGAAAVVVQRELELLHARMRQSNQSFESSIRSEVALRSTNAHVLDSDRHPVPSPQDLSESPQMGHSPQQKQREDHRNSTQHNGNEDAFQCSSVVAASSCLRSVLASLEEESLLQLGARAYAHLTDQVLAAAATPAANHEERQSVETIRASKDSHTGSVKKSQVRASPRCEEEWLFPLPLAQHKDKLEARRAEAKSEALRRAAASKHEAYQRVMGKKAMVSKRTSSTSSPIGEGETDGRLRGGSSELPQSCEPPLQFSRYDVEEQAVSPLADSVYVPLIPAVNDGRSLLENNGTNEENALHRSPKEVQEPISPREGEERFGVINVPIHSSHRDHADAEAVEVAREKRRKQFEAGLRSRRQGKEEARSHPPVPPAASTNRNPPSEASSHHPPHRMAPRLGTSAAPAAAAHAGNHQNVRNALTGVCLAGGVNAERLADAIEALSAHGSEHVVILLVEGQALAYRGLYAIQGRVQGSAELVRLAGKGPQRLQEAAAEKLYKYSSARRAFIPLPGFSALASTTDAISLTPMAMKRLATKSPRP